MSAITLPERVAAVAAMHIEGRTIYETSVILGMEKSEVKALRREAWNLLEPAKDAVRRSR